MTVTFTGCGIAGVMYLGRAGGSTARARPGTAAVTRIREALAHRGPHGAGLWHQPGIVLGHRRLAVTGLGPDGDQPMTRDHLTIVYNGEVYNAPGLRAQLAEHYPFTTGTDTEVVLRAWQRWGPACLSRFNGMFAFAVFDQRTRSLHLVRDRIGVKPLYYHDGDGFVLFASEIEALLASGHVPRQPDIATITRQLLYSSTLQTDPSRTLVDRVLALPPATHLTLHQDGGRRIDTYWQLPHSPTGDGRPGTERNPGRNTDRNKLADELQALLADSVAGTLMGDVPVAAFLSGGLDSSAICALAAARGDLDCVTVTDPNPGPPHEGHGEDLRYSRIMADHLLARLPSRVRHHFAAPPSDLTVEDIDAVCDLAALGDDPRHPSILANYRAVHDLGLRVVLNGQGADEIMGGYLNRPGIIRHLLDVRRPNLATADTLPASRQVPGLSAATLSQRRAAHDEVTAFYRQLPGLPLERAHRLLVHTQLVRVVQFEDFLAMRTSVEARFPFLDHRIVEWAFRTPFTAHVQHRRRQGKVTLVRAMRAHLPAAVLARPKAVFPFPPRDRLQPALAAIAAAHLSELRDDPLISAVFAVPADPAAAPIEQLWPLLWMWRWHCSLHARPVPATV